MTEDFDIEAMLEAPYKKETTPQNKKSKEDKGHSSSSDEDDYDRKKGRSRRRRSRSPKRRSRSPRRRSRSPKRRSRSRSKSLKRRSRSRSYSPKRRAPRRKHRSNSRSTSRSPPRRKRRSVSKSRSRSPKRRSRSYSPKRRGPRRRRRSNSRSPSRTPPRRRRRSGSKSRSKSPARRRRSDSPKIPSVPPSPERTVQEPETPEAIMERDQRTVFCMQLARNIRPRDLEEFFSKVGQVSDVRIISDRNSRRSKGIAYIEFTDKSAVPLAINLSGNKLLGAPIMVMPTQAEKNRLAAEAEKLKQPIGPTRLYVGSLHFNITEAMIKAVFEPFGIVDSVQLIYDSETNRSKGYGFVQFRDAEAAKRAMEQMNGFELAGRPLKVGPVTERGDSSAYSFLDDEEYEKGGVELNSTARAALMAKLSQGHSAGLTVPGVPPSVPGVQQALATPVSVNLPTPCFMLTNMFDPTKERDEGWDQDIRDDVLDECSKFGPIVHIHVDKSSPQGIVYVKCYTPDIAVKASKALHGRWFAGKQIIAAPIPLSNYHTMFPNAISASRALQPSSV